MQQFFLKQPFSLSRHVWWKADAILVTVVYDNAYFLFSRRYRSFIQIRKRAHSHSLMPKCLIQIGAEVSGLFGTII